MTVVNTAWRVSSRCETGACIEWRLFNGAVEVRDSKNPDGRKLTFTDQQWTGIVGAICGGADVAQILAPLTFTADEITAFVAGVRAGEFPPAPVGG